MNNYFFRPFQALPQQIPGGLRGAIFEDENGDFNIYINQDLCDERKLLTVTLFSKTASVKELYFRLRDLLAVAVDEIKHRPIGFSPIVAEHAYQHPKNLNAVYCAGKFLGEIGIVNTAVAKKIDKKANIVFAEIDIEEFASIKNASIRYVEPSKFPEIEIDLSFVSNKFAPIGKAVADAACPLVKKVEVVDTYEDENGKSITSRITFAHPEKTLTKEEVMDVVGGIIADLETKGISLKK